MTFNPSLTRRQALAGLTVTATLPYTSLLSAQENKMRGALMILSTPYNESGEVDYDDLAKEVAF